MPTAIYDASLITKRERDKMIANEIRIRTNTGKAIITPQIGYASYTIEDNEIGSITFFRREGRYSTTDYSCYCFKTVNSTINLIDTLILANIPTVSGNLDLSAYPTLRILDVHNTDIQNILSIPNTLEYIDITNTEIMSLNNLDTLVNLQQLYMGDNSISSMPLLPPSLIVLDISNTNITNVTLLPSSLIELNVSNTSITSIPSNLNNLKALYLTDTEITTLPVLPDTLEILYVNGIPNSVSFSNSFSLLSDELLGNLIELNISRTNLSIPDITKLTSLLCLDISDTNISSIPLLPPTLEKLYVSLNSAINVLAVSFPPNLNTLDISFTTISDISNIFTLIPNLLLLNISDNLNIYSIPAIPSNIVYLDISDTNISTISLNTGSSLQRLDVSGTPITSLPLLPYTLIYLDISDTLINQASADQIVSNLYANGTFNGTILISNTITYNSGNWISLQTQRNWTIEVI